MAVIKRRVVNDAVHPNDELADLPAILQRIFRARGIVARAALDKRLQALLPFHALKGIEDASARLGHAVIKQQRILVVGDFDVDGATSSALAVAALRAMGARYVEFLVPNRFEFGYGLTPGIVDVAARWQPHLIITVDNGMSSIDGVARANELGIDVLITDHHLPVPVLPAACAVVNPNQAGDVFLSKAMAGVGVIFYVMLALRQQLRQKEWFSSQGLNEPNMAHYLDLVALGTVADVVPLDHNNRIMVSQGLARMRQGLCRPGILALIQVAGRECSALRESDLGFAVGPRLNAAGRLDDMSLGIDCLLAETMEEALRLARELDELNQQRRLIEAEMSEQALLALKHVDNLHEGKTQAALPVALCLMDESFHQGVIGLLAGRLKDRYARPTIIFAPGDAGEIKGSARSIAQLNIRDVLAVVDGLHPGLIVKFGGHAMAAGLTLQAHSFQAFAQAFLTEVSRHVDAADCQGEILSDGPLASHDLTLALAKQLQEAGPWGQQFPEPVFDNRFEILEQRTVGKNHLKLALQHESGGEVIDAIMFNVDATQWPNHRARFLHAAYKLDINHYRNRESLQLMLLCISPVV